MTWWEGLVLGLVQGLTEFLPVSSSGHLVLTSTAFGVDTPGVLVEVVLHVGTLLAVVLVYWRRLLALVDGAVRGRREAWIYLGLLALATIPAGLVGLLLKDFFERAFDSLFLVGVDFLVTGTILWSTRTRMTGAASERPSPVGAFGIGVAQAFAILPGISRSGTTVTAAVWMGIDPVRAAEFSFLMALPAIAGAAVLQLGDLDAGMAGLSSGPLVVGFLSSLVAGVLAIRFLLLLLRRRAFHRFAPYLWTLGTLTVAWALLGS